MNYSLKTIDTSILTCFTMTSRTSNLFSKNSTRCLSRKSRGHFMAWIRICIRKNLFSIVALKEEIWTVLSDWEHKSTIYFWELIRTRLVMCYGTTLRWQTLRMWARKSILTSVISERINQPMKEYYLHPTKGMRPFVRRARQQPQQAERK